MFLPPWAMNYHDFVRIMRESLESKYVTEHIGNWIDLTFGVHQRSIEKMNIFNACAYDEFFTKDKLKSDEEIERRRLKDDEYVHQS
jgi:hypothetical protein